MKSSLNNVLHYYSFVEALLLEMINVWSLWRGCCTFYTNHGIWL